MSTAIPSQHPAVVLRSQYNRLRNLLAIAMIAVVGLSVAVVVVSSDDAPSTSDVIATGKFAPAKNPSGTTRYDGGPEEGTRGAAWSRPLRSPRWPRLRPRSWPRARLSTRR